MIRKKDIDDAHMVFIDVIHNFYEMPEIGCVILTAALLLADAIKNHDNDAKKERRDAFRAIEKGTNK